MKHHQCSITHIEKVVTCHTRLTRDTCRNDHQVRTRQSLSQALVATGRPATRTGERSSDLRLGRNLAEKFVRKSGTTVRKDRPLT